MTSSSPDSHSKVASSRALTLCARLKQPRPGLTLGAPDADSTVSTARSQQGPCGVPGQEPAAGVGVRRDAGKQHQRVFHGGAGQEVVGRVGAPTAGPKAHVSGSPAPGSSSLRSSGFRPRAGVVLGTEGPAAARPSGSCSCYAPPTSEESRARSELHVP